MARAWFESFGNQNNLVDLLNGILTTTNGTTGNVSLTTGRGLVPGKSLLMACTTLGGSTWNTRTLNVTVATGYQHWSIYLPPATGTGADGMMWFAFLDSAGAGCQASVGIDAATGTIYAFTGYGANTLAAAGSVAIGQSAAGVVSPSTWYDLEISVTVSLTAGVIQVRLAGAPVAGLTLTNVVTQTTANATFDTHQWGVNLISGTQATGQFTDAWFNDTTGSSNTGFPGPLTIQTRFATSNVGTQWTASSAEANVLEINETAMDSDASYNFSGTVGNQDTFASTTAVPTNYVPIALKVQRASKATIVGTAADQNVLVSGTTTLLGTSNVEAAAYSYHDTYSDTDPATSGTWTAASVLATDFGYKKTA